RLEQRLVADAARLDLAAHHLLARPRGRVAGGGRLAHARRGRLALGGRLLAGGGGRVGPTAAHGEPEDEERAHTSIYLAARAPEPVRMGGVVQARDRRAESG